MDLQLNGKTALVTAASKGLGLATAVELAKEGANVVITARNADNLAAAEQKLKAIGSPYHMIAGDLLEEQTAQAWVDETIAQFGTLDILITNAGGPPTGKFDQIDTAQWEHAINLTFMSAVRLIRAALPHLRQSDAASILTITSISVKQPVDDLHLSNVIRPAVIGLTKSLSRELGSDGIRVNSILPGWTRTERVEYLLAQRAAAADMTPDAMAATIAKSIPLGRIGEAEEFGKTATFLVSPAASYISGVMLQVDGGRYSGLL